MNARVYVMLDIRDGESGEVSRRLQAMPGVVRVDVLEGSPKIIMVIEASVRQELAEMTVQALASIETVTEDLQLLPVQDA